MLSRDRGDEPIVPSWDGELAGWSDYARRVRLCYAQTMEHKRHTLGPKLVLKLRGKAWEIASTINHDQLTTSSGTQYLLHFLRDRLGRLPVPDLGQHLDDLFLKSRRAHGVDMVSWANQLRESYRRVQRSLARTGRVTTSVSTQTDVSSVLEETAAASPTSSSRRRLSGSEPHGEPQDVSSSADARDEPQTTSPAACGDDEFDQSMGGWSDEWWNTSRWYASSWYWDWDRWGGSSSSEWRWRGDGEEETPEYNWQDIESSLPDVFPEEVLGWLLLKRSGLSSASRLSIQAASGNSLRFSDIERAMRQQEEELMQQERNRNGGQPRTQRTYWVEEEEHWGILLAAPEEYDPSDEYQVHWLDTDNVLAMTQADSWDAADQQDTVYDGGLEWAWFSDEWHAMTEHGWVAYSDMKPWLDLDDISVQDAGQAKELQDLYAAFESKVRTFKEAREAVHQKGKNRGYYQPNTNKGTPKGKGKFKGKKGSFGKALANFPQSPKGKGTSSVVNRPGYLGCFICGEKDHDYRNCPKRGVSGHNPSKGSKPICMVTTVNDPSVTASSTDQQRAEQLVLAAESGGLGNPLRYAVIDTGATETVGSLDAVEFVIQSRHAIYGDEEIGVNPNKTKRFRFGNGHERHAESFITIPQTIDGMHTSLGVYTMDVPGIPILLGVQTMMRLGAVVDVAAPSLTFTKLFPNRNIPLIRGQNGHLLLDLCKDWTQGPEQALNMMSAAPMTDTSDQKVKGQDQRQVESESSLSYHPHPPHVLSLHLLSDDDECSVTSQQTCELPDFELNSEAEAVEPRNRSHEPRPVPESGHVVQHEVSGRAIHEERFDRDRKQGSVSTPDGGGSCQAREVNDPEPYGSLRLEQGDICRSPRPSGHGSPMFGGTPGGEVRQGFVVGDQQVGSVAHLQRMPFEAPVLSHHGIKGDLSLCGTSPKRCLREAPGEGRGQGSDQGRSSNSGLGTLRSRDECPPSSGGDPQGEDQGGRGQDSCEGGGKGSSKCGESHEQEDCQARPPSDSRGPGVDRCDQRRLEVVSGMITAGQLPMIHDDALYHQESDESVCHCAHLVSAEQKEFLCSELQHASDSLIDAFTCVHASTCDLMEVCCGPQSRLTETVKERGGIAYRVGLENNMDLSTNIGFERARAFASEVKPRWMMISTPCGPTSNIQNLNQKTEKQIKQLKQKQRRSRKIIGHAVILALEQLERGGEIIWEWPVGNQAWNLHEVRRLLGVMEEKGRRYRTRLDGCQVGVVTPDTGEPMLKPWRIETTSPHMHQVLSRRCTGNHEHKECLGHGRAESSGYYPRRMCLLMSRVMMESSNMTEWQLGLNGQDMRTHADCSDMHMRDSHEHDETKQCKQREHGHEGSTALAMSEADVRKFVVDEKELKNMKEALRKIHVRAGHPTNRALYLMLKARGVRQELLDLALELKCDECQEIRMPVPHKNVSFNTSHVLWQCMQADIGQLPVGDEVLHFLLMVDEASRFTVAAELFRHSKDSSRNATSNEIIRAVEQSWVQYHGYPGVIRTDPEGCFRGTAWIEWAQVRGVELAPCAGEDHSQIGVVEATIKKIKNDARTFLRNEACDPMMGVLHVVNAHNELDRIGGFAPAQWAYGRLPSFDQRLFEADPNLPFHSSEGVKGSDLRANLNLRVKAEEVYRRTQAVDKINRAINSKSLPFQVFVPGDLVYYRRYKTPMGQQPSHGALDQPKMNIARWYGPARVLATETRAELDPATRKPGSVVWVIAGGRLKRCSPHQLRHCSEREKLLAEASEAITIPWSFNSLMHLVERGQFEKFDDLDEDDQNPQYRMRSATPARKKRSSSVPQEQRKTPKGPQQDAKGQEPAQVGGQSQRPGDHPEGAPEKAKGRTRSRSRTTGPSNGPQGASTVRRHETELERHPPFQAAQRRAPDTPGDGMIVDDILSKSYLISDGQETTPVCCLQVDLPQNAKELKSFLRDIVKLGPRRR